MRILLSIRPEFAASIFTGKKKYEFRRSIFRRVDVTTVVVYATAPVSRVVGEFDIEAVICESLDNLWQRTKDGAGISKEYFLKYFENRPVGYAIAVKNYRKYDLPVDLKEVFGLTPPQSFLYLDQHHERDQAAGS